MMPPGLWRIIPSRIERNALPGPFHERLDPKRGFVDSARSRGRGMKPVELSGDVVTGASALAGLFLVYLGNVATAFSTFDRTQQASVRGSHQTRGWLAFAGIVFAILAAGLALLGKWLGNQ